MANPNLDLIQQNILKGLPISKSDLGYIVERLTDTIDTQVAADEVWNTSGTTTLNSSTAPIISAPAGLTIRGDNDASTLTLGGSGSNRFVTMDVNLSDTLTIVSPQTFIGDGDSHGLSVTPTGSMRAVSTTLGDNTLSYYVDNGIADTFGTTIYQNRVTTTNATVTTIHTLAIPASTTVMIIGYITARRTGGASGTAEDGAGYEFKAVYKNVAGTATIIGSATITAIGESQAGFDVTLVPSTSNVLIRVTGAANNNISWHLNELRVMTTST